MATSIQAIVQTISGRKCDLEYCHSHFEVRVFETTLPHPMTCVWYTFIQKKLRQIESVVFV